MTRFKPLKSGTYQLSSPFGPRGGGMHYGQDFAANDGTPIYAAQAGTVAYIGAASGFGQWIVLDHPTEAGSGTTVYGHMWDAFATGLKQGDHVEGGQPIAYVGSNGQSSGAHLHFEVHPTVWKAGSQIDPMPWLYGAHEPGEAHVDTLFADVSEFQVPVDDSYPHPVLSIRVSDGTYRDHKFAQNYAWMRRKLDEGRLAFGIVYTYVRPNWQANADTVRQMIDANGGLHPRVALMLDVESGGNPAGDGSDWINRLYWNLADYAGSPVRVIGYANSADFNGMWRTRPDGLRIIGAGYGSNPNLPGQVAHQYTDGQGYGHGLPEGAPPFGNCDMNSANGLDPQQFAAACGIGTGAAMANAIDEQYKRSPWLGAKLTREVELAAPDGRGRFAAYEHGHIYWTPETGAWPIPERLFEVFVQLGFEKGPLGYPVGYHAVLKDGDVQAFERGVLYRKYGQPGFYITGLIGDRYRRSGYEQGPLGWPTSNEVPFQGGVYQEFENGRIAWSPDGTVAFKPAAGFDALIAQ